MGNLIQLQGGNKSYGVRHLFTDAQFSVNDDEHVGVIGPNGAGKTTLFRILVDEEHLDSGTIVRSNSLRLGYLAQHDDWEPHQTVEEYLDRESLTPLWELKSLGRQLGLSQDLFAKPIASLSEGFRMRCKLLFLIGQKTNLMLLDEPTNYLDLETTLVLEGFLQDYKGAFLLISHDREFLRRTTDHILEIEQGDFTKFNGNLDDFFEQKSMLRQQLEARALSVQEKRKEILAFVSRFGAKATKARQAQSRLKSLDRLETIELKSLPLTTTFRLPAPIRVGKQIVAVQDADLGYGERVVLKNVNFQMSKGDHVAVVGLNGAGKSTFLKALAQVIKPIKGQIEYGYQVSLGYYAQHVSESLNPNHTVIEEMMAEAHPSVVLQDGLNMAGSLLFSGDEMKKRISVLSGGEKSRVALGRILLKKAPFLLLDEPTNHLDFQTVEALTQALADYEGSLIIVSHDRSFVRRVGTKILEIRNGTLTLYPGTYDEYVWSLQKGALSERNPSENPISPPKSGPIPPQTSVSPPDQAQNSVNPNYKAQRKDLDRQLKQAGKLLGQLDEKLKMHSDRLCSLNEQIAEGTAKDSKSLVIELAETQQQIEEAELQWLDASEKKEQAQKSLDLLVGKSTDRSLVLCRNN